MKRLLVDEEDEARSDLSAFGNAKFYRFTKEAEEFATPHSSERTKGPIQYAHEHAQGNEGGEGGAGGVANAPHATAKNEKREGG